MEDVATTVESVRSIGSNGVAVELAAPGPFDANPGQFVNVTADVDGETVSRVYTISSPEVSNTFEVTVEVDPEGTFTPWLADASAGTGVEISGPYGNAHYEGEDRVVIVAGGPGVGPAVAIGERVVAEGGDVTIVYRDQNPFHEDRLSHLADQGATVTFLTPDDDLSTAVDDAVDGVADAQVFVYGFDAFVSTVRDAIEAAGSNWDAAKVENFG